MKRRLRNSFALVAAIFVVCAPLLAHHGSSVTYKLRKAITLKGTVTEFVSDELYTNGDAVKPRSMHNAIRDGYLTGMRI